MTRLKGTPASPGLAIGPVYLLQKEEVRADRRSVFDSAAEVQRMDAALLRAEDEIRTLRRKTAERVGESEAEIFDAHMLFLHDPSLVDAARDRIRAESVCAEWAFQDTGAELASMLAGLDDEYLRERAADVRDVVQRVVRILMGRPAPDLSGILIPSVVVAGDLTPSETAQINPEVVLGFATDIGGPTSHTAIMARTLGIPAVVGLGEVTRRAAHGDPVVLDGGTGELVLRPDATELEQARAREAAFVAKRRRLAQLVELPAETKDGVRVELAANIGRPAEASDALKWGAEGVGLFRTEFLYMDRPTLPTEEEQYRSYKHALEIMGESRPVIIRTLDIGGDKHLDALPLPHELNPFLGLRAIRICFDRPELFRTQLRALLRAAMHGHLRVMYPMIQSVAEVRKANALMDQALAELQAEGIPARRPEVGIMVEIPAAAAIADLLAPHVDFFSIGTNDLIQYSLAVDRMNERVAALYEPFHPAVLRLIAQVCAAGKAAGKWTGMCGEMAGDALAAPVLLGLGLEEWSMSASSLPAVKEVLRAITLSEAEELARSVLSMADPAEIRAKVADFCRARGVQ